MPNPKPKFSNEELMKSSYVQKYINAEASLDSIVDGFSLKYAPYGLSYEQYSNIIMMQNRENTERFSQALKRNGVNYPKGLSLSKFSSDESKKKEQLSLDALNAFARAKFENSSKVAFINTGVDDGIYTKLESQELQFNRDNPKIMFKPGTDPKTIAENKKVADYMLLKDVNKDDYTEEEYSDLSKRRFAEIYNKRMEELASVDYSKYDNLSDEDLVKNWVEFSRSYDAIYVIRKENERLMSGNNKYLNHELAQRCNQIEQELGNKYMRDTSRMQVIANPYYSKYDVKGFEKLPPSEYYSLCSHMSGNNHLANMLTSLSIQHNTNAAIFKETIVEDLNKKGSGVTLGNVSIFDSKGNLLSDQEDIYMAAKKGPVFAAPQDRPDLLKPYVYDPNMQDAKPVDPKPYEKLMSTIKSNMPDIRQQWAREEEQMKGGAYESFMNGGECFKDKASSLAEEIERAKNPQQKREVMLSVIKRNLAPAHPKLSYDEYADIVGIKPSERLAKSTIEERRQLTELAMEKMVDHFLNKPKYSDSLVESIKDTSPRQFSAFMLKSSNTKEQNDAIITKFFNGDGAVKKQMVLDRVAEYEKLVNQYYGKEFTDKYLVENMEPIFEVSTGMGMEFITPILKNSETWGMKFSDSEIKMMKGLNEKAYALNNNLKARINMVNTTYYQYGGVEELAMGETTVKNSGRVKDELFHKSQRSLMPDVLSQRMERGTELLREANPNGLEVDFIYDANKNFIPTDSPEELGQKAFDSGRVYVFLKGQKDPVVMDCIKSNRVPIECSKCEKITPEMEREIENMRFVSKLDKIDHTRGLSPEKKEIEKNLVYKGFELETIGQAYIKSSQNRTPLKRHMSEFLANLTVRQMLRNGDGNIDSASMKALGSEASIKKLAADLRRSPIVELVIEDMLKKPDGFKNINPDTVYNSMLNQMGKVRQITEQQKQMQNDELKKSIQTVAKNKDAFIFSDGAAERKMFGLSTDLLDAVSSSTKLPLSVTRTSINTQAFSILLEQGLTVDEILDNTPKMQKYREMAAKLAISEVVGNKTADIRNHLKVGTEKLNQYISAKLKGMKDFSATEMAKPENRNLRRSTLLIKDFFQELNTANNALPKDQRIPEETIDKITNVNDMGNKVFMPIMIGMQEPLNRMIKSGKDFNPCDHIRDDFKSHLMYLAASAAAKEAMNLPENKGKPLEEIWTEQTMAAAQQGYINLALSEEVSDLMDKCEESKSLANKVYRSMLDDTARKDLNVKVQYKKDGGFDIKMDVKGFTKAVNEKLGVDIPNEINRLEKQALVKSTQNELVGGMKK